MNATLWLALAGSACAADLPVSTPAQLHAALLDADPGDRILIAPGTYAGNFFVRGLHGTAIRPIVIMGANPANLPVLTGSGTPLHLAGASYVAIYDLAVAGYGDNGLNIDDDGVIDRPSHDILLRNLRVVGGAPAGNRDGIKLSGVTDVRLLDSAVEGWGTGGSGVDLVGCHRVLVGGCSFRTGGANAVQIKGGSSQVWVAGCRFVDAGERAIQAGGSTGLEYFRPALAPSAAGMWTEARDVVVEGNLIVGSEAAVACCTATGVTVRQNTVYAPRKWFLRILQETADPAFAPCGDALVSDNLIVFRSTGWSAGGFNVGVGTAPRTFAFAGNAWYCEDNPALSAPAVPTPEDDPFIGLDPRMRPAVGDFRVGNTKLVGKGYLAFTRDW